MDEQKRERVGFFNLLQLLLICFLVMLPFVLLLAGLFFG